MSDNENQELLQQLLVKSDALDANHEGLTRFKQQ